MKAKLTVVLLLLAAIGQSQTVHRYDIVITEIMADPVPSVGLPNAEFIELMNTASQAINLNGWQIGDANGFVVIKADYILLPDSFVIVCSPGSATALSVFGKTIPVTSFPSLDNNGDLLYLRSKEGMIIHSVEYNTDWYQNPVKKEGGWTLEMIDSKNPCSGFSNWTASNDSKGGTPGKRNSVDAINTDQQPPALLRSFISDSLTIILLFDEPLDSSNAVIADHYNISDGIGTPQSVTAIPPLFNRIQLRTASPLIKNKVYNIIVTNINDCAGNTIGAYNKTKSGIASLPDPFDLVINEILFNPKPDGVDYVELYNRSDKIIELKDCYIANRASNNSIGSIKQISPDNRLLFPGEYIVITENAAVVKKQYLAKQPDAFSVIASMPSYPDDKGDVIILNIQGTILDELQYDEHWHFKLIDNNEGVALERINYNNPAQDAANWHSAATDAGYGTPGYQNSQYTTGIQSQGNISITASIFSPDNDGFNDFATIDYQFPTPGYTCNITIYDANGRPVRYLTRNALCGLNGYFRWDGLGEKANKLPIGIYVIYTEAFNLQGSVTKYKHAITLARRL